MTWQGRAGLVTQAQGQGMWPHNSMAQKGFIAQAHPSSMESKEIAGHGWLPPARKEAGLPLLLSQLPDMAGREKLQEAFTPCVSPLQVPMFPVT